MIISVPNGLSMTPEDGPRPAPTASSQVDHSAALERSPRRVRRRDGEPRLLRGAERRRDALPQAVHEIGRLVVVGIAGPRRQRIGLAGLVDDERCPAAHLYAHSAGAEQKLDYSTLSEDLERRCERIALRHEFAAVDEAVYTTIVDER